MARMIQAYPLPQVAGLTNNYNATPKESQDWNQGDGRVDWNRNERNSVFGRFSMQETVTTRPSTFPNASIPGFGEPVGLGNEDTFAGDSVLQRLQHRRHLGSHLHADAADGSAHGLLPLRSRLPAGGRRAGAQLGEKLGVKGSNQGPNSDGIPIFSPAGYTGIGQTRSLPIIRMQNTFHPSVNFTWITGTHSIRFGGEARNRHVTQYQTNRGNGRFNFGRTFTDDPNNTGPTGDAMAALLMGVANTIEQDFTLFLPAMRYTEWGGYIQDDWKMSNKLTLNIGLRYEIDTTLRELQNKMSNFDVVTGKLMIAGFNSNEQNDIRPDKNNFGPRFGFAYHPDSKTVIRGGAGLFYNPAGSEAVYMRRHRQLPFGPINLIDINQFVANPRRVADGLPPDPEPRSGIRRQTTRRAACCRSTRTSFRAWPSSSTFRCNGSLAIRWSPRWATSATLAGGST